MTIQFKKHNPNRFDIISRLMINMNNWYMSWNELIIEHEENFWSLISSLRDAGEIEICNELFRGRVSAQSMKNN